MAAVLVLASASTLVYTPSGFEEVATIQNLGPNPIFVVPSDENTGDIRDTGLMIAVDGSYDIGSGETRLWYARAATADQVAGNETRVVSQRAYAS